MQSFFGQYVAQFTPNPIYPPYQAAALEFLQELDGISLPTTLDPIVITPSSVVGHIRDLDPRKAPGVDGMPCFVVRHLPLGALLFLTKLYNSCLSLHYYHSIWRTAKVSPVLKPTTRASSYRPISVLCVLGKLLDSIILSCLMEVVDGKRLLNDFQYGFRPDHSTVQQLFRIGELITTDFNRRLNTGLVSLDLAKAFDKVWHPGLLYKLHIMAIPIRIIKLIRSYLSGSKFRVLINGVPSSLNLIQFGVPQGSSLGPVLFTLYINYLPHPIDHRLSYSIYADDTAILATSRSLPLLVTLLQRQTNLTIRYYERWGLINNALKTKTIVFNKAVNFPFPQTLITINSHPIEWSPELKYLGVTLDQHFLFIRHLKDIKNAVAARLRLLFPVLSNSPTYIASILYKSYICPLLTYASPSWYSVISLSRRKQLQVAQNNALRVAAHQPRLTPFAHLHNLTGTPTLDEYINRTLIPTFSDTLHGHTNPTIIEQATRKFAIAPRYISLNFFYNRP